MTYFVNVLDYLNRPLPVSRSPQYWLSATAPGQTITANSGSDAIYGVGGDTLVGGTGDDTFYVTTSDKVVQSPGGGVDTIVTYWGSYVLPDNVQNLVVQGDGAYAEGNSLDNLITAVGPGEHTLDGGGGNNVLSGGSGEDIFIHAKGTSKDVITNFQPGTDEVRLENYALYTFADVQSAMQQVGTDVVIALGMNDSLTFRNVQISQLSPHDFMLPLDYSKLHISFEDEFNSLSLRSGNTGTWSTALWWTPANGGTLASNGEQEWYLNANYAPTASIKPWTINNGVLDLTAAPASSSIQPYIDNYKYTSGMVTAHDSFAQTYGYFEIRAEVPAGKGLWGDFWLLPEDGSWPPEIDVLEFDGGNPTAIQTGLVSNATGQHTYINTATRVSDATTAFHTYGVDWEPDTITWYIDGNEVFRTATPADMHKPMYMLANLAVGSYAYGNPDSSTLFPATMQIDYIHAYATTAAPPVISTFAPDTNIARDGITKANVLTLNGTSEGNSTVNIYDGTKLIGTALANGIGAWNFTTGVLADGSHSFATTDTNAAGNTSVVSSALSVTVDTHVPNVPSIKSFSPDSNIVGDSITNANHLTLAGTAEANSTVKLYDGTSLIGSAQVTSSGSWTFTTGLLADGTHKFSGVDVDVAGTASSASSQMSVTVDTVAPHPIINAISANANGSATLTGTSEANSQVTVYDNSTHTLAGAIKASSTGTWSFSSAQLTNTVHSFSAQATDVAGNTGAAIGSTLYTIAVGQTLTGGPSNNFLVGLGANDTFVFAPQFGKDVVAGFQGSGANHDMLQFDHTTFNSFAAVLAHAAQVGNDLVITADAADAVTVKNFNKSALQASDVHIV